MDNKIYWIWLADIFGPANRRVIKLLREFGNALNVYKASDDEIFETGVFRKNEPVFCRLRERNLSEAGKVIEKCNRIGAAIVTPGDAKYPKNLLSLMDAPLVLYIRGKLPDFGKRCTIAVVGSRTISDYGKVNAYKIGYGLGAAGAVVASGLALGVDGVAMAAALDAGGCAVGVLGGGIDNIYPKQHEKLYRDVVCSGAVISEYPPGTKPSKYTFPQRNRIISGISQGTTVIEAREHSGALITARAAAFQGKPLYALPGHVDSVGSKGPIRLIREGASAVTCAADILEEYSFVYPHTLNLEKMRMMTNGVIWEKLIDSSTEEHRISYKKTDPGTVKRTERNVKSAESADNTENTIDNTIENTLDNTIDKENGGARRKSRLLSDSSESAPFGKFIGRGKVEKSLRVDFELLGENEKKVYFAMPCDTPLVPEEIKADGMPVSDVLAALTMLEISGAVEAGAGGYYMRSSEYDIFSSEEAFGEK